MAKATDIRIGVDTGGTFTDFVVWKDGRLSNRKVLSTPRDPSVAVLAGVADLMGAGAKVFIVHGTTVATNALLEGKGGRIALVATAGFEDVLTIGRQTRRHLYRLRGETRPVLLPRARSFGLAERVLASGDVEKAPDALGLASVVKKVKDSGAEAVAVCLLHSYANPVHERVVARALRQAGFLVSVSSEVLPEYREYERTVVTAVNAYLMPVMDRYLHGLERRLGRIELRIMQSNGGYITPGRARREPIRTALSGPAGGAVGALSLARAAGHPDVVSFDMGGTSTDVALIEGVIRRTNEARVGDFPVRLPMIDIHSVGAGGGSIAYRDRGGSLRVGPLSAGADPGPACYGQGEWPTVTDANLFLGRLDPDFFLGGRMKIHPERSRSAIARLARTIGKTPLETALGVIDVANANMEKAIRVISVERGYDPRVFSLFSFGGAGGMHAVDLAGRLRMPRTIVPLNAGVLSAFGLLMADSVKDYTRSVLKPENRVSLGELEKAFREIERTARRDMEADGFRAADIALQRSLDLRYVGQSYEITVPYHCARTAKAAFLDAFHREHRRLYSYHHPGRTAEVVNIRIQAVAAAPKIRLERRPATSRPAREAVVKVQTMHGGRRRERGSVYDRARLAPGHRAVGPALIVDQESTTFLPSGVTARVDGYLNLIITGERGAHAAV
ncbi:MAG: hydantoinase/oxoprolinase family protein [Candidatus Aminicenantes bacterium]|nr:hydantoinase/oxoprolinase family protein [Candidatus Aminicenantes bacterium]